MSIVNYFSPARKRNHSSTSESDSSRVSRASVKQASKRVNSIVEEGPEMQEALDKINHRLECLDSLATKEDVSSIRQELRSLRDDFMNRVEQLEGRVFELEEKADKHVRELTAMKKKNEELQNTVRGQDERVKRTERELNDLQQYSRRWNVRVYRVPEAEGGRTEDVVQKVCRVFSHDMGVTTSPSDIEVAHRAGQRGATARPILVRFFDRKKRDTVIANKKKLKNKGVVVSEDLTYANYKLCTAAFKHTATMAAWSVNGKVFAKLKNGVNVQLDIHMDLDDVFRRAMM